MKKSLIFTPWVCLFVLCRGLFVVSASAHRGVHQCPFSPLPPGLEGRMGARPTRAMWPGSPGPIPPPISIPHPPWGLIRRAPTSARAADLTGSRRIGMTDRAFVGRVLCVYLMPKAACSPFGAVWWVTRLKLSAHPPRCLRTTGLGAGSFV